MYFIFVLEMKNMKLLEKFSLKGLSLQNRMAMAPMTRSRASAEGLVGPLQVEHYVQRASAGLIISEGINISAQAVGNPNTPGIWNAAQVAAWRTVTDAVHVAGGKMYAQLWHTSRVGHSLNKGGEIPVAPSPIGIIGQQVYTSQGPLDYETPRELSTEEVKSVVKDFRLAAENAHKAGFDGVELHGAYGYLPNQFLVDGSNLRTDEYGGSIENRSKFVLEVMAGLVDVFKDGQVGIKLSPTIPYNNMVDSNPLALYTYLIGQLNHLGLAYIHLMQPIFPIDQFPHWPKDSIGTFGPLFDGAIIANAGYDADKGEAELQRGIADMVSFGRLFISNPDLPARFASNGPFNAPDTSTFYAGGANGYTDYPSL